MQANQNIPKKKLLEKPFYASLIVPAGILLVSIFIIYGVMKMLSHERTHRDLIGELHSKTFGNRWVAAYELSKVLATSKIPSEEIPWVIQNLSQIYLESNDARTRNFIVMAIGTFKNELIVPTLIKALDDTDSQVQFNAIVNLGNLPTEISFDKTSFYKFLDSKDSGLVHAAILAIATHKVENADKILTKMLSASEVSVRYAAVTALINYKNAECLNGVEEILSLKNTSDVAKFFNESQLENLKLNVVNLIAKNSWKELIPVLEKVMQSELNTKVKTREKEALILLKN